MTLTNADYARIEPSYTWRCASCARVFATNKPASPAVLYGPAIYQRDPISAVETKERALACCAEAAHDSPALHTGFWTRPAPGALATQILVVPMYGDDAEPTTTALELALTFVDLGASEVWSQWRRERRGPGQRGGDGVQSGADSITYAIGSTARISGYRLDVFIDEDPENRREYFTSLLAGLRLYPNAGSGPTSYGPYTFERMRRVDDLSLTPEHDDQEDIMFHGFCAPRVPLVVPARQAFFAYLAYGDAGGAQGEVGRWEPLPIGFMRLVVLGEITGE